MMVGAAQSRGVLAPASSPCAATRMVSTNDDTGPSRTSATRAYSWPRHTVSGPCSILRGAHPVGHLTAQHVQGARSEHHEQIVGPRHVAHGQLRDETADRRSLEQRAVRLPVTQATAQRGTRRLDLPGHDPGVDLHQAGVTRHHEHDASCRHARARISPCRSAHPRHVQRAGAVEHEALEAALAMRGEDPCDIPGHPRRKRRRGSARRGRRLDGRRRDGRRARGSRGYGDPLVGRCVARRTRRRHGHGDGLASGEHRGGEGDGVRLHGRRFNAAPPGRLPRPYRM